MIPECLVILVPGAGLEPARTLPGPWDFKSTNYSRYQQLICRKVQYQRGFPTGAVPFCSFQHSSLVTAIVTMYQAPNRRGESNPDSIGTVDFERR